MGIQAFASTLGADESGPLRQSWAVLVVAFARMFFWFGVALALLGSLITFYPGAEVGYCAVAAIFVAAGLLVPGRKHRIAAVCLLAILFAYGFAGHRRGIEHQQWLDDRAAPAEAIDGNRAA